MKPRRLIPEPIVWILWIGAAGMFAVSDHPVAAVACMGGLWLYVAIRGCR